ncbi:MAG TPA: flagellin [Burkholderiaceae bacterium]|nr:flagellin [Burkholderiaceae bacterium]
MAAFINTNIASLNAQRNLNASQGALATSLQRLSSGLRINSAKDDAAGLAISERMTSQIKGMNVAARNANDGISLAQTAEGDLVQIGNNLQRMRELAVQSANASNSASDRSALNAELQALSQEIDRVSQNSEFNGVKLLNGTFTSQTFQVGANNTANDRISIASIASARTTDLGSSFTANKTSANTLSALGAGDLTIQVGSNVFSVGAATNGTNGKTNDSAMQIAAAINATSSGVTATANATTLLGAAGGAVAGHAGTVDINGATITVAALSGTQDTDGAAIAAAIQGSSATTGVTATYDTATDKISLNAADGRNIVISNYTGTLTATDTGLAAATTKSTFSLTSSSTFILGGNTPANAGLTASTVTASATGTAISAVDISSVSGAQTALASIDSALNSVNSSRANLGAIQNRFTSVVASLQTSSENLSASRSRIQDTDFASETASLTRGQILQQAGTAMLAQANSLPNGVLALLRG